MSVRVCACVPRLTVLCLGCSCWAKSVGYFQWIIYVPNLFCLVVSPGGGGGGEGPESWGLHGQGTLKFRGGMGRDGRANW